MYCRSCYRYMYIGFTLASQRHPALEDLLPKIPLVILHTVFLKNRLQINKNNYRVIYTFYVQTSQSAETYFNLILQEMTIDPKAIYMLWFKFTSSSNFFKLVHIFQTGSYFSNQFIFFKLVHIYQTGSYFSNWVEIFKPV